MFDCDSSQFFFNLILRPKDLDPITDLVLFKKGLKPIWEDSPQGGKWIIRLKKGIASRYWENLLLALIGDQFKVGEEICGAVISVRQTEDILSLWNKDATNKDVTYKIKETLKVVLDLPEKISMEYKAHNSSLADNSSFRNTTKH
ncbi:Eukaryotic translation initiation factor 4E type 2 [Clydaea vesicula]|uniref:Eukaryotic translation initiation factor 4E type 2 n=1 Tax=Clydaea vesicula TaxID=447962 RepID=A0AAD5TXG4_9FUNG|nr:Eukaryotic translation initiation factor 4E type 2 [Clydaea vesicula]